MPWRLTYTACVHSSRHACTHGEVQPTGREMRPKETPAPPDCPVALPPSPVSLRTTRRA